MIETLLEAERLLVMGMLDQAERLYRRTVDADPRNAMALVGLARVSIERADDRQAYDHACAALEVDPQNAAALRLEARLSEVMTARGEPVERPAWLDTGTPADDRRGGATENGATDNGATPASEDLGVQAQRAVLARNRSMTDHRRMNEEQPAPVKGPLASQQPVVAGPEPGTTPVRRGILRRLLGR